MAYPAAYIEYLVHFHGSRDYFECHEVLEEHWKSSPEPRDHTWVGLIQIAVGMYHHRRQNRAGAIKMLTSAHTILSRQTTNITTLGLDPDALLHLLSEYLQQITNGEHYQSQNLPIVDSNLLECCRLRCAAQGVPFGQPSQLADHYLVNKHTRRDRSEVIAQRQRNLAMRTNP